MNEKDVLALLIYCNELDGRHSPNELKVRAWHDVFRASSQAMTLPFAQEVARNHYATIEAMITPNVFVRAWRAHQQARSNLAVDRDMADRHCRRSNCQCVHSEPCYRGWLDNDRGVAVPCPVCRGSLARVLAEIPPVGMRQEHDSARIRNRYAEAT